jgi:hypothetical protein
MDGYSAAIMIAVAGEVAVVNDPIVVTIAVSSAVLVISISRKPVHCPAGL